MQGKLTYEELEKQFNLMKEISGKFREIIQKNEENFRRKEERYQNILECMEETYYEVDLKGNYTFFNATEFATTGFTENEIVGRNFRQYVAEKDVPRMIEVFHKVFLTGQPVRGFERKLTNKASRQMDVEMSIFLMRDSHGNPVGFKGYLRDISARKRVEDALRASEEQYRLLAETAADVIFTMDENLCFTYMSPSITRLCGYTVEEAMAQSIADVLTPASLEVVLKAFAEEMEIESHGSSDFNRIRVLELEEICRDGSIKWTESIFNALRNEENKFIGLLGITRDISERKSAEAERDRLILEKEKALSEVKVLSGMLPICVSCKKIRDDQGYWNQIETYITNHSEADFSHSLCPDCAKKMYPRMHEKKEFA